MAAPGCGRDDEAAPCDAAAAPGEEEAFFQQAGGRPGDLRHWGRWTKVARRCAGVAALALCCALVGVLSRAASASGRGRGSLGPAAVAEAEAVGLEDWSVSGCMKDCTHSAACRSLAWCSTKRLSTCDALGQQRATKPSMLCYSLATAGSTGMQILANQVASSVGIAACDEYLIFSDRRQLLVSKTSITSTYVLDPWRSRPGSPGEELGLETHVAAFKFIRQHYVYRLYDWIIKVDPYTVFMPNQLKSVLQPQQELLVKLDNSSGSYQRPCDGAAGLDIVQQRAFTHMMVYLEETCPMTGAQDEASYFLDCYAKHHVPRLSQSGVALDDCTKGKSALFRRAPSCGQARVAYFGVSSQEEWTSCWKAASTSVCEGREKIQV